jgi:hypothetical protein
VVIGSRIIEEIERGRQTRRPRAPPPGWLQYARLSTKSPNEPRDGTRGDRMSWLQKLLPPRIKASPGTGRKSMPEGLWVKCQSCEAVLYRTDLEKNLNVCPKCNHHARLTARELVD